MTYNPEIHAFAPFPSGALPTEAELRRLAARSRRRHLANLLTLLRRLFSR